MVKIAHSSDWHLGYTAGRLVNEAGINIREQDGYDAIREVADDIIAQDVDMMIVAGDIFHTPKPTIRSIVVAQEVLKKIADAGIRVYLLAGNHDASDIRSDIAASKVLDLRERGIYSHVDPYVKYEVADGMHLHLVSHHMYSEQKTTMDAVAPVDGDINIFSTHGSIIDRITQIRMSTEQSPREIIIPDFVLHGKEWSYRMLGHIHERKFVGSEDGGKSDTNDLRTFYNGSLIRRGFSDAATETGRGWTLWTVSPDGEFSYEMRTVHQRPQYDFGSLDCSDLSSSEISDVIIDNLKTTQDTERPILRQRLHHITASKELALDFSTIEQNSSHALTWKIKSDRLTTVPMESEESSGEDGSTVQKELLDVYDDWFSGSGIDKNMDDAVKKKVGRMVRRYIKESQEKRLGDSDE